MPTGDLSLRITDMAGEPVRGRVEISLEPEPGDPGAGGESMTAATNMGASAELTVTKVACRAGPGTLYRVAATAPHYRTYSFFQSIREKRVNTGHDNVEFWVKPGDVRNIRAPAFGALDARVRAILADAEMRAEKPEDRDLAGASGAALYGALGPLRKACLLNVARKAAHPTSAGCLRLIRGLLVSRQDRFFALVDDALPELLRNSPGFQSAPDDLHTPLAGFEKAEGSFKSRDGHANLQVTFMRESASGRLAADIDIDEAAGIGHGFEVIRNALFKNRTNPYLIREFLLAADPVERTLDPAYAFEF
jgi:hypothetical protein